MEFMVTGYMESYYQIVIEAPSAKEAYEKAGKADLGEWTLNPLWDGDGVHIEAVYDSEMNKVISDDGCILLEEEK